MLAGLAKTQLLRLELGGGGGLLWAEVTRPANRQGRVEVLCCGELLQLSADAAAPGGVVAAPAGYAPRLGEAWVKAVPGLADSLKWVRQQQEADGSLPSQLAAAHGIVALHPLQTLAQFQAEVAAAPGPWIDGTAPGDPPLDEQQQALLTAGELAAFLGGARGVCLLQLRKGWGDTRAGLQPLLRPWALELLRAAAGHKGVALLGSAAPEGLGASLVLAARQQPWHAWGKRLAGEGVQSSIVADSPFYKLLIGEEGRGWGELGFVWCVKGRCVGRWLGHTRWLLHRSVAHPSADRASPPCIPPMQAASWATSPATFTTTSRWVRTRRRQECVSARARMHPRWPPPPPPSCPAPCAPSRCSPWAGG